MLNEFPTIHTNMWDVFWAIPVILVLIFFIKLFFGISNAWISTAATVIGLLISIFISHPEHLAAGVFMGFFYGNAAAGFLYSFEKSYAAYRKKSFRRTKTTLQ